MNARAGNPLRRIHLIPRFGRGGAAAVIRNLVSACNTGEVLVGTSGGDGVSDLVRVGIPWLQIPFFPSTPYNALRSFFVLRRVVRTYAIDLIHSHHRFSSLVGRAVALSLELPFVCTVHDLAGGWRLLTRLSLGRNITVFSEAARTHLVHHFRVEDDRIHRISMGVPRFVIPAANEIETDRRRMGCTKEAVIVAFAGRLEPEKGPDLFLRAGAALATRLPNVRLWVLGDGEMRPELEAYAGAAGLNDRLTFFGWRDDATRLMACADIVVVPSRREAFSLVALEALALGNPVVATEVGALPELVRHEENGLLVAGDQPGALYQAVSQLAREPELRRRLGKNGAETVRHRFRLEDMLDDVDRVYRRSQDRHFVEARREM